MTLEGIHHVTCITADAPANVEFYAGVLGLRLSKKTVNQDDPTVYHLFYTDEKATPGSDITFFEYPGARQGHAGAGMVHRVTYRVGSEDALGFWEERLSGAGVENEREGERLRFHDPEGLGLELAVVETEEEPLAAEHPEIPFELALQGFDGVRAYTLAADASQRFLETGMGFTAVEAPQLWESRGADRSSVYAYDPAPYERGAGGAGTVHHVAWSSQTDEHAAWRERVDRAGAQPTPVIDRFYFKSIYFREPSGVLFEIATMGPGFTSDEPAETLGERLSLPPNYEPLRERLEQVLTPLPSPRESWTRR